MGILVSIFATVFVVLLLKRASSGSLVQVVRLRDFSHAPRGTDSAEIFRNEVLVPALNSAIAGSRKLQVDLRGVVGPSSSWIEVAFGGLARNEGRIDMNVVRCLEVLGGRSVVSEVKRSLPQIRN